MLLPHIHLVGTCISYPATSAFSAIASLRETPTLHWIIIKEHATICFGFTQLLYYHASNVL